jgi:hypothetical protein
MDCSEHPKEDVAMNSPTLLCIDDLPQALELRKATLESQGDSVLSIEGVHKRWDERGQRSEAQQGDVPNGS